MDEEKDIERILFQFNQELKIMVNERKEDVRQGQLRAEEAKEEMFREFNRMAEVAFYGSALLATAVAALTVVNGM